MDEGVEVIELTDEQYEYFMGCLNSTLRYPPLDPKDDIYFRRQRKYEAWRKKNFYLDLSGKEVNETKE